MHAITHVPSPRMDDGLRTHLERTAVNYQRAVTQHAEYCGALTRCGAEVRTLGVNRALPDCVFVEDTAVVLDELAVLAPLGTEARRAERDGIEPELRRYREVHRIEPPAVLEGGDVLRVGRTLFVGLSSRTDWVGLRALEAIVQPFGYRVVTVPVCGCLHLKTAVTALPDGALLVNPSWLDVEPLRGYEQIPVPDEEPWAANVLPIGENVCLAAEHPRTAELIIRRGFRVHAVELSEFAKAEGGVTCLSLLVESGKQ
jgi:dimethylargininase